MLITKFINDSSRDVIVPIQRNASHRWLRLPARGQYNFKNNDEKDLYARYDMIRFVDDPKSGLERYRVETHIRAEWKEPKNPGLTLVVENFEQSQGLNSQYSTENWSIPMPFGIRLVFYNIMASEQVAEFSKIETQAETVEYIRDPYEPGGRREIKRGGGVKTTRRPVEELLVVKKAREQVNQQMTFTSDQLIRDSEKEKKRAVVKKTKK